MRAVLAALVLLLFAGVVHAAEAPAANPFFSSAAEEQLFLETQKLRTGGKLSDALRRLTRGLSLSSGKPSFAAWTTEGALIFEGFGRYRDAEMAHKRALEALEHEIGPESPAVCIQLQLLARLYLRLDRFAEAERLLTRALAIAKKLDGAQHPSTALVLASLGELRRRQSRFAESELLLDEAVQVFEASGEAKRASLAETLTLLAYLYRDQRRIPEAAAAMERVHDIDRMTFGPKHAQTARDAVNLALMLDDVGRGASAEAALERALAIREEILGPDHPETAQSMTALASHYADRDRLTEAEQLCLRALAITERAFGPGHPDVAQTLERLAFIYREQGRATDAEPLYKRALAITEKALGPAHRETAASLANLATLYGTIGRNAEAAPLLRRVIAIDEKRLGADHPDTATATANLGAVLSRLGRNAEAERLLKRALAAFEKTRGADHLSTAHATELLAQTHWVGGRTVEADGLLRRSLEVRRKLLPPGHRLIAGNLHWLSHTSLSQARAEEAYAFASEAATIFQASDSRAALDELKGGGALTFARSDVFAQKARTALALAAAKPARESELRAASFDAAQRAALDDTGRAVDRMAARFAARSANVADLLRKQQLELRRLRLLDKALIGALGSDHPTAIAWTAGLRRESADIAASLNEIDAALRRDGGAYADLADPRPVNVAEAQALLKDDEAIVLTLAGAPHSMVFALSKTEVRWATVKASDQILAARVAKLRRQLDPDQWRTRPLEPFDRAEAYRLHQDLLAPVDGVLKGKSQIFVVPTGALTSLPFSVLVTAEPQGGAAGDADPKTLRETAWLIKRHALTVLPSISSLRALRVYANKGSGSEPFAGFGDPSLAASDNASPAQELSVANVFRGTEPDVTALRKLALLPQTADELRSLAKALGASDKIDVYLRERATETQIKTLDLSKKRVIAFATHGLMAGDMGLGEPGLVLTPPATPSEGDDGYLSASEVAGLDLRADWIILSACNTAAGDAPGAKGLSGLARAFFLAGAKSLLVSHWPVWDDAAMKLTTGAVANMAKDPARGRAEALRQAMLAVMSDASTARFAHPAAWASFVLVGETRAD
jgi:CHAT domain-containing protein/tetratricopeptide (TPR) repeat protein